MARRRFYSGNFGPSLKNDGIALKFFDALRYFPRLVSIWCLHHWRAATRCTQYLQNSRVQFLISSCGLGLMLTLPLLLYLLVMNVQHLGETWKQGSGVFAYLKIGADPSSQLQLADFVRSMTDVREVIYKDSDTALVEFRDWSGQTQILDGLDVNPIPATLEIYHRDLTPSPRDIERLRQTLEALPEVDEAHSNEAWLAQYHQLGIFLQRAMWLMAFVVVLIAVLSVALSARLMIMARREELRVVRLMGGSDAYITRPFLYLGFSHGLVSIAISCIFAFICMWWLHQPMEELIRLYDGNFNFIGFDPYLALKLIASGGLLGIVGAGTGVRIYLQRNNNMD